VKLVGKYQEISNSSFEIARCPRQLQSGVKKPMDHARALSYKSCREEALQSTRRLIRTLENSGLSSIGLDSFKETLAILEAGQNDIQSVAFVQLFGWCIVKLPAFSRFFSNQIQLQTFNTLLFY